MIVYEKTLAQDQGGGELGGEKKFFHLGSSFFVKKNICGTTSKQGGEWWSLSGGRTVVKTL